MSGLNITGHELQYDLVGTIHHAQRGIDWFHYTSICKTQHSRNWFKYDNESVSVSKFLNMKQKDRVLKNHTRTATMLFYVSTELQKGNGSQVPIAYLTNDANERGSSQPTTNPAMQGVEDRFC